MRNEKSRKWGVIRTAATAETAEKYAALRVLANKSGDRLAELDFYASEMRSRRFWQDFPFGHGAGRFWFGLLFGAASDFGRSLWRPFMMWFILFMISVLLQLFAFSREINSDYWDVLSAQCAHGTKNPLAESSYLSLAHGAVLGLGNPEREKIAQRCLFGEEKLSTGSVSVPKLPIDVAVFTIVHSFVAGICFFLVGLALRNNFRAH